MIAALELDRRLERAGNAAAYLAVNVPLAILGAVAVLALVLGAMLSVVWIGLPLLLGAAAACRRVVRLDRRAANRFLGTHIPPVPGGVPTAGSPWRRSLDVLSDRGLWRMVALLTTKPLLIAGLCARRAQTPSTSPTFARLGCDCGTTARPRTASGQAGDAARSATTSWMAWAA